MEQPLSVAEIRAKLEQRRQEIADGYVGKPASQILKENPQLPTGSKQVLQYLASMENQTYSTEEAKAG